MYWKYANDYIHEVRLKSVRIDNFYGYIVGVIYVNLKLYYDHVDLLRIFRKALNKHLIQH